MSNGMSYGYKWQKPVGWLDFTVPQTSTTPMVEVAKKLAFYMGEAANTAVFTGSKNEVPSDRFYRLDGGRGPHHCTISNCGIDLGGVFGFREWKFPTGIVHYILDHSYLPPEEFLKELAELPDPPEEVVVPVWCAPNKHHLFQTT